MPMRSTRFLPALSLWFCAGAFASPAITNVSVVNITSASFSVVWITSTNSLPPGISVFADANGVTNLAGQVGIEYYPLHTGAPDATNAYDRRLSRRVLQQKTAAQGLAMVRVSGCLPHRSYFFRLQETDSTGGQTVWPPSGPLPSAMTAQETGFVIQSRQLSFSLPGFGPRRIDRLAFQQQHTEPSRRCGWGWYQQQSSLFQPE